MSPSTPVSSRRDPRGLIRFVLPFSPAPGAEASDGTTRSAARNLRGAFPTKAGRWARARSAAPPAGGRSLSLPVGEIGAAARPGTGAGRKGAQVPGRHSRLGTGPGLSRPGRSGTRRPCPTAGRAAPGTCSRSGTGTPWRAGPRPGGARRAAAAARGRAGPRGQRGRPRLRAPSAAWPRPRTMGLRAAAAAPSPAAAAAAPAAATAA